jgi:tRNA uridine 5-carboxymethylaminomethyl modification enzyme
VDDLITRGVSEPYRMFTSRAEYRLQLREDNADARLTEIGRQLGLVDDARWARYARKRDAVEAETARLKATWAQPDRVPDALQERVLGKRLEHEYSLFDLLRRPEVSYGSLAEFPMFGNEIVDSDVAEQVEIAAKYAGYIARQKDEVARQQAQESEALPTDFDYATVRGLSKEVQLKLNQHKPQTIGQASRIQGITPAAISLLLVHLKKRQLAARQTLGRNSEEQVA